MNLVRRNQVDKGRLVPVQPIPLPEGQEVEIETRTPNNP
jgi:predicted DNA-binding antitoxin AbrB/MazE fold protein